MSAEAGMPIVKRTLCKVGAHVWVKTGTSDTPATFSDADFCNCGLLPYHGNAAASPGGERQDNEE